MGVIPFTLLVLVFTFAAGNDAAFFLPFFLNFLIQEEGYFLTAHGVVASGKKFITLSRHVKT